jgi:hypothetical protein
MTRSELHGRRALLYKPLLPVAAMSAWSLRRRCVDGRDKPGHDGKRSPLSLEQFTLDGVCPSSSMGAIAVTPPLYGISHHVEPADDRIVRAVVPGGNSGRPEGC